MRRWLETHEVVIFVLIGAIFLRIPSLFEPYWYGDEGIYLTIGQALHRGLELYKQIHDNKPPFLYLVAALVNGNLFWFRFCALVVNLCTIFIFAKLASRWQSKSNLSLIIFAILTTIPLLEGNIANAELFFILFTVVSFFINFVHKKNWHLVASGLILGLGALFKIPALLEVAVWPLFWFASQSQGWFKKSFIFGSAALVPLLLSIAYFASRGTLPNYLIAAGIRNVPYLASWHASVPIIGTLWGRAMVIAIALVGLWLARKKLDHKLLLLSLWWLATLFAALLSGRPYPHYLLQMAPVLALTIATARKSWLARGLLGSLAICFVVFGFYVYPVFSYYGNFLAWVTQQKDRASYFQWFNPTTNRDYEIAAIVMPGSKDSDQIFVWGDVPIIYALSKRQPAGIYTAKYHILDFQAQDQTWQTLKNSPPRYIVTFDHNEDLPGLPVLLGRKYVLEKDVANAQVYRRLGYN